MGEESIFPFVYEPLEELLEISVTGGGGRRLVAGQLIFHERLDVLWSQRRDRRWHSFVVEKLSQELCGRGVGDDRLGRIVGGP